MSDTLEIQEILRQADEAKTIQSELLYEKSIFKQNNYYSINGGTFELTPAFILYASYEYENSNKVNIVLIDIHDNPILIENPVEFLVAIREKYRENVNRYFHRYTKLINQKRT